jgi:hypothetical protein
VSEARGSDPQQEPESATPLEQVVAERLTGPGQGIRVLAGDSFSFADAIGGTRGLVESTLPGLVFVVVYVATRQLVPSVVAAAAAAALAVVLRLVQRTPPTQAFSGLVGVAIGVAWALWTGRAGNYFAGGLLVNVGFFLGALLSILLGWPLVGVVVSTVRGEPMTWRRSSEPADVHRRRRYVWSSWVFVALFGARLAVQVPLYLRGDDAVGWLGTAKLVMGVPLFALALWVTWLLVGSPGARAEPADPPRSPPR